MVRSFERRPLPDHLLNRVLEAARWAPSAGNTQGLELVVLRGAETKLFWEPVTAPEWRTTSRRRSLLGAPVVILPLASPEPYLLRYAEPDKASSGLDREDNWPQPYWVIDTAFAVMAMLLAAVDSGLGAAFLGIWRNEAELLKQLGIPLTFRPIGAIALGYPAPDVPSPSLKRHRRGVADYVHYGRW